MNGKEGVDFRLAKCKTLGTKTPLISLIPNRRRRFWERIKKQNFNFSCTYIDKIIYSPGPWKCHFCRRSCTGPQLLTKLIVGLLWYHRWNRPETSWKNQRFESQDRKHICIGIIARKYLVATQEQESKNGKCGHVSSTVGPCHIWLPGCVRVGKHFHVK